MVLFLIMWLQRNNSLYGCHYIIAKVPHVITDDRTIWKGKRGPECTLCSLMGDIYLLKYHKTLVKILEKFFLIQENNLHPKYSYTFNCIIMMFVYIWYKDSIHWNSFLSWSRAQNQHIKLFVNDSILKYFWNSK